MAQVTKIENYLSEIKTLNKNVSGKIFFDGLKWTKKNFQELLKIGDLIFVKKKNQKTIGF